MVGASERLFPYCNEFVMRIPAGLRIPLSSRPVNERNRDFSTTTIALCRSSGILSFGSLSQGVRMSRHRSPQFSIVASWGMWLLSLVLGGGLSLAAQQPADPSTQTSPDSSPTRQQKTPSTDEGSAAR